MSIIEKAKSWLTADQAKEISKKKSPEVLEKLVDHALNKIKQAAEYGVRSVSYFENEIFLEVGLCAVLTKLGYSVDYNDEDEGPEIELIISW